MPVHIEEIEESNAIREKVLASVGDAYGEMLTLSAPLQVGTVALDSLVRGEMSYTEGPRWQCLVGAEEPSAAVDVIRQGDEYLVVSINRGELAPRLNEAIVTAEKRLDDDEYMLSEVEIPGLHLAAARLVSVASKAELLIPVLGVPGNHDLEPMDIYRPEDLAAILQRDAAQVLDEGTPA
jgi:hypothetical protein